MHVDNGILVIEPDVNLLGGSVIQVGSNEELTIAGAHNAEAGSSATVGLNGILRINGQQGAAPPWGGDIALAGGALQINGPQVGNWRLSGDLTMGSIFGLRSRIEGSAPVALVGDVSLPGLGGEIDTLVFLHNGATMSLDQTTTRLIVNEMCIRDRRFNVDDESLRDVNFTTAALAMLDEGVLGQSRQAIDTQFAEEPLLRARMLYTLAGTMNTLGLPEKAEAPLVEALQLRRDMLGEDHSDTLDVMTAHGELLGLLGRNDEAVGVLRRVYARRGAMHGPEDPRTLRAASSLGGALRYSGQFEEAARVWEHTLAVRQRVLGHDHGDTLATLNNVGVAYALGGNLSRAEEAWTELLERRRRQIGEDHPLYQSSLTNLGLLLHERGKLTEARELLAQSLASLRQNRGDEHPSRCV